MSNARVATSRAIATLSYLHMSTPYDPIVLVFQNCAGNHVPTCSHSRFADNSESGPSSGHVAALLVGTPTRSHSSIAACVWKHAYGSLRAPGMRDDVERTRNPCVARERDAFGQRRSPRASEGSARATSDVRTTRRFSRRAHTNALPVYLLVRGCFCLGPKQLSARPPGAARVLRGRRQAGAGPALCWSRADKRWNHHRRWSERSAWCRGVDSHRFTALGGQWHGSSARCLSSAHMVVGRVRLLYYSVATF